MHEDAPGTTKGVRIDAWEGRTLNSKAPCHPASSWTLATHLWPSLHDKRTALAASQFPRAGPLPTTARTCPGAVTNSGTMNLTTRLAPLPPPLLLLPVSLEGDLDRGPPPLVQDVVGPRVGF